MKNVIEESMVRSAHAPLILNARFAQRRATNPDGLIWFIYGAAWLLSFVLQWVVNGSFWQTAFLGPFNGGSLIAVAVLYVPWAVVAYALLAIGTLASHQVMTYAVFVLGAIISFLFMLEAINRMRAADWIAEVLGYESTGVLVVLALIFAAATCVSAYAGIKAHDGIKAVQRSF